MSNQAVCVRHIRDAPEVAHFRLRRRGPVVIEPQDWRPRCSCLCPYFPVFLPEGFSAIVSSPRGPVAGDAEDDTFSAGVHILPRHYRIGKLISRGTVVFEVLCEDLRTAESWSLTVEAVLVLRVARVHEFVEALAEASFAEYVHELVEERLREVCKDWNFDRTFSALIGEGAAELLLAEELAAWGVEVQRCFVRDVRLPAAISEDQEAKLLAMLEYRAQALNALRTEASCRVPNELRDVAMAPAQEVMTDPQPPATHGLEVLKPQLCQRTVNSATGAASTFRKQAGDDATAKALADVLASGLAPPMAAQARRQGDVPLVLVPRLSLYCWPEILSPADAFYLTQRFGRRSGQDVQSAVFCSCCARIAYVVRRQPVTLHLQIKSCLTRDLVRVVVDVLLVLQVTDADRLAYDYGVAGLDALTRSVVELFTRRLTRQHTLTTVLSLRGSDLTILQRQLLSHLDAAGVTCLRAACLDVQLPGALRAAVGRALAQGDLVEDRQELPLPSRVPARALFGLRLAHSGAADASEPLGDLPLPGQLPQRAAVDSENASSPRAPQGVRRSGGSSGSGGVWCAGAFEGTMIVPGLPAERE